jgi:hypothetical protein
MMGDDLYADEFHGSVVGRSVLAGLSFGLALITALYWVMTSGAYQTCSSPLVSTFQACSPLLAFHPMALWVVLIAIIGGIIACIWASRA